MRLIFFGTPQIAADIFSQVLKSNYNVVGVVSQLPKEAGRGKKKTPSQVAELAKENNLPLFEPVSAKDPEFLSKIKNLKPDLIVVVAYGQILIQELLDIPPLGCINVHASLLSKYRGAAPMERALMNGESKTGVTIMKMVRKMDAGDAIVTKEIPLTHKTTLGDLQKEMAACGAQALLEALELYKKGEPKSWPQDENQVTFAAKITKEDRIINWQKEARALHNQIRALSPRPAAICFLSIGGAKKQLKVLESSVVDENSLDNTEGKKLKPGEILFYNGRFFIGALKGAIELKHVQLEGKKEMRSSEFIRGFQKGAVAPFAL